MCALGSKTVLIVQVSDLLGQVSDVSTQLVIPGTQATTVSYIATHFSADRNQRKSHGLSRYAKQHVWEAKGHLLGVVLPLLEVILPEHFDLMEVVVHLPVNEIDFLQKLLLVVF